MVQCQLVTDIKVAQNYSYLQHCNNMYKLEMYSSRLFLNIGMGNKPEEKHADVY